jgi:Cdc6-like AAA superfamily ATPase
LKRQGWAGLLDPSSAPDIDHLDTTSPIHRKIKLESKEDVSAVAPVDPLLIINGSPPRSAPPHRVQPSEPILSEQQNRILQKILAGDNFFFTGSAGTGKSVLLRAIIKAFGEKAISERLKVVHDIDVYMGGNVAEVAAGWGIDKRVQRWKLGITASTGMAAMYVLVDGFCC